MNKTQTTNEEAEIQSLRKYLNSKFISSFFGGLSLEKDYTYINDIKNKYPNNPSALIAQGYLDWRFGKKESGELLFEKAFNIAKETNYELKWFEIGVNTFLGSSIDLENTKSKPIFPEVQYLHLATAKSPVIFASCDDNYFQKFGRFFVDICLKHSKGTVVHIHVINPSEKTMGFLQERKGGRFSCTIEQSDYKYPAYYALNRFLIAPFLLEKYNTDILVIDIDQAIIRQIDKTIKLLANNTQDIAIPILSNSWMPWNYYLATNVFLKNNSRVKKFLNIFANYCDQAVNRLNGYENAWFIDQNAMFKSVFSLEKMGGNRVNIQEFGPIAVGPAGLQKDVFSKLLQTYNSYIDFSGKSKIKSEDELLLALKPFLKNKQFALMFLESHL